MMTYKVLADLCSVISPCVQIFSGLLVNLPSVGDWLNWLKYLSIPRFGLVVSVKIIHVLLEGLICMKCAYSLYRCISIN